MVGARTLLIADARGASIEIMLGVPLLRTDGQWCCRIHALDPNIDGVTMVASTPELAQSRAAWFARDAVRGPEHWSE